MTVPDAPGAALFYVVAPRKFAVLFVATLGMYALYWFYKNWDRYKDRIPAASTFPTTVAPVVRAAFSVFFVHALLRKVKAHGQEHAACRAWAANLHASLLVLLLLADEFIELPVDALAGRPWGDIASLAMLAPLLFALLHAQRMINIACGDPAGAANAKLTRANWIWIVLGTLGWLSMVAGMVLPIVSK